MYGQQAPVNQFGTPYYGAAQPVYGDIAGAEAGKGPFAKRRGGRASAATIILSWLLPSIAFCAVCSLQTFSFHYDNPSGCKSVCLLLLLPALALLYSAAQVWRSKFGGAGAAGDPLWSTFLALTYILAWVLGMILGNKNFVQNMTPYRDVMNLNTYDAVSPADYRGQQLMDAGHINFAPGSKLDLSISMGFKNLDTYCVAPITSGNGTGGPLDSYDFWAVGLNCCSGHAPDFHCGEYNNVNALSGLRLMRDDLRAYFRLAVQQAEAAYNIHANHPIFMYWMQDPQSEVVAFQTSAYKTWLVSSLAYAGGQLVLVLCSIVVFSKIG